MMYILKSDDLVKKKYLARCERLFMREKQLLSPAGSHKEKPNLFDMPWIKINLPPPDKPEKDKAILEKQE